MTGGFCMSPVRLTAYLLQKREGEHLNQALRPLITIMNLQPSITCMLGVGLSISQITGCAGNGVHQSSTQALVGSTIPAPLLLSMAAAVRVHCAVSLSNGSMEVTSGATAARTSVHLRTATVQFFSGHPAAAPVQHASNKPRLVAAVMSSKLPRATQQHMGSSAILAADQARDGSGYLAHPALVDGCLHMGAHLADALRRTGVASQAWVPVAIGAFDPMQELATVRNVFAGAEVTARLPDGSATSSYRLRGGCDARGLLHLADLQAKPARLAALPAAAAAAAEAAPRLLYKVQWQSSAPLDGMHTLMPRRRGIKKRMRPLSRGAAASSAAASCLGDITNIQRAMAGPGSADFELATQGVSANDIARSCRSASDVASGAAAWGLVRVAASEHPDARWAGIESAPFAIPARERPTGQDAFGTILDAGYAAVPRILGEDEQAAQAADSFGPTGRIIITGGLGGDGHPMFTASS